MTQLYIIEDVRKRFMGTPALRQYLPMLDEYIFQNSQIEWLCRATIEKVVKFCEETNE
jgi:hypothetical protein